LGICGEPSFGLPPAVAYQTGWPRQAGFFSNPAVEGHKLKKLR
jgi:hypothetical protein